MYHDLPEPLLNAETMQLLTEWASVNAAKFVAYKGQGSGLPDGNNYLADGMKHVPGVQTLMRRFTLMSWPIIMMHRPRTAVHRHVDDKNRRNSVIIQPLYPVGKGYSGTYFWDSMEAEEPIGFADFSDGLPKIVDTQVHHSLINDSDEPRFNFQICFDEPFEVVKQLYLEGKLLK